MNIAVKTTATCLPLTALHVDGGTQPRAAIYENVIEEYAEAIKAGAVFPPVVAFYDGAEYWLADGFHRHAAYRKIGIADIPVDIRQGTRRDAVLYSVGANQSHGLRRTNEDKRRAVLRLLDDAEWCGWTDKQVAHQCGVTQQFASGLRASHKTVLCDLIPPPSAPPEVRQKFDAIKQAGGEPRLYKNRYGAVSVMDTAAIGRPVLRQFDLVQQREIIEQAKSIAKTDEEARRELRVEMAAPVRGTLGTGDNEWFTPAEWIDLARAVLGEIDLDPASNEQAQRTVRAAEFYTIADDGLTKDWRGNVWLNPPYAQPHIENFADKMLAEVANGHVDQAIMLTHNYTDTAWFQKLAAQADAICFPRGRIRFEAPDGSLAAPTQGQALCYFGERAGRFVEVFGPTGLATKIVRECPEQ